MRGTGAGILPYLPCPSLSFHYLMHLPKPGATESPPCAQAKGGQEGGYFPCRWLKWGWWMCGTGITGTGWEQYLPVLPAEVENKLPRCLHSLHPPRPQGQKGVLVLPPATLGAETGVLRSSAPPPLVLGQTNRHRQLLQQNESLFYAPPALLQKKLEV